MSDQFTAFWIDGHGKASPPIATGKTKSDALALAAQRVLADGITTGSIGAQEQDNITAEQFADLTRVLDEAFAHKVG